MTTRRSFRWGLALASLPLCILLASPATAQEAPPDDSPRVAALFQFGMEAAEAGEYDKAIAAFRRILVNRPDLVRVRLELARAFFLNRQDGLARRHFELVLAGGVPPPVAANIRAFLVAMQTRRRFTGYFGAAIAPDSNLNAASESEIIYLDTVFGRLPFTPRGRLRRPVRLRLLRVGRRRVPAAPEPGSDRLQAAHRRRRRRCASTRGRDFDQLFLVQPTAGRAGWLGPYYRPEPAGHGAAPVAGRLSLHRTSSAPAWSWTAG